MEVKKILASLSSLIIASSLCLTGAFAQSDELCKNIDNEIENQTNTPKVSIIVPVYNCEKYIDECLDSLTNQTLNEIEIICVNDGSKDSSLNKLKERQETDPRIIIIDKENGGVSAARNDGIKIATGEYIEFVDGDDYIDEKTCETAYENATQENADIICFGWKNFTDDGSSTSRKDCSLQKKTFYNWRKAKKHRASIISCNKLYRRSMLQDNKLAFNPDIRIAEDECFNLCVYPFAKKIVHIPYSFYNYRVNLNSATKTMKFSFMVRNYIKVWKYVNNFYKERKIKFGIFDRLTYFMIYKSDFFPTLSPTLIN